MDDRDYRAKLAQAEANVKAAQARLANSGEDIRLQHILVRQAAAQRGAAVAALGLARRKSDRRNYLFDCRAISPALVDESDTTRTTAAAGSTRRSVVNEDGVTFKARG